VIVAFTFPFAPVVVAVNVAVLLPAFTVTDAGTETAVLLLESDTGIPPVGAAAARVTVPVDELPPTTVVGFSDRLDSVAAGATVSVAVCFTLL
jgi:hypothetical protein